MSPRHSRSASIEVRKQDPTPQKEADVEEKETLSAETLELLRNDLMGDSVVGSEFHSTIAERWAKLVKVGYVEGVKAGTAEKVLPASNCPTLKASVLNPEVKSAMSSVA